MSVTKGRKIGWENYNIELSPHFFSENKSLFRNIYFAVSYNIKGVTELQITLFLKSYWLFIKGKDFLKT